MFNKLSKTLKTFSPALASIMSLLLVALVWADESLPSPQGSVILEITGKITKTNGMGKAQFDHDMLAALGFSELTTSTPWTEGVPVFTGIQMSTLLDYVGAEGDSIHAIALNDYKAEIPLSDFDKYPVMLASTMNGKRLRVRDKGPLWIVYPFDQFEELAGAETRSKCVWQLKELQVQ